MKKLSIGLLITLIISCGLIHSEVCETNALRETEQDLLLRSEELQEQIRTVSQNISESRVELDQKKDEKKQVLEAHEIWQKRTEEIRSLLSD